MFLVSGSKRNNPILRTDLFKTVDRAETRFIAIRDTLTKPDLEYDIQTMDEIHCKSGRLGVGWHFLVLTSGTIQLGRDIETCGAHSRDETCVAHSKDLDKISAAVGVVGGVDEHGTRINTRTVEQREALDDLMVVLGGRYPDALTSDVPAP